MQAKSVVRRSGWVAEVGAKRVEIGRLHRKGAAGPVERKRDPGRERLAERLEAAGFPSKLAEHGAALVPAIKSAAAIRAFEESLGWNGRTFSRLTSQFYKTLDVVLANAPAADRPEIARRSLEALERAILATGDGERLIPAIGAIVGLFDFESRQIAQGQVDGASLAVAVESAAASVASLESALEGRAGVGRALTLFPALIERLERAYGPMSARKRSELRERLAKFLVGVGPLTGFAPETAGRISLAVTGAIAEEKTPARALARAARSFADSYAERRETVKQQLRSDEQLAGDKKAVMSELDAALQRTLAAHPTAPEAFHQQLTGLRSNLFDQLRYDYGGYGANKDDPTAFLPLIALVARFGPTELAAPVLGWVNKIYYSIRSKPEAGALIAKAAAEPNVAKGASYLAEASARFGGNAIDPDGPLQKELDAIGELTPSVAMAAALALHQSLQRGGEHDPTVVRALIREAKRGRRDDPSAHLEKFTQRIGPFLGALAANGVEERQDELATELARVSSGASYLGNAAENAVQIIRSLGQKIPDAEPLELVESGIWPLVDPNVRWRVQPRGPLDRILDAIGPLRASKRDPSAATRTAGVALELARVIGNLDGDHEIPFSRILADLQIAFSKPGKLSFAQRGSNVIGVRARQNDSALTFLRAHPELPLELAFSAGVHLNATQVGWLCERCASTRGRDTIRALRDFTFACIEADQKKLFDAIRTSNAPAKNVSRAIYFIARAYREDKLAEIPWRQIQTGLGEGQDPIAELEELRTRKALEELNLNEVVAGEIDPAGLEELSRCGEAIRKIMEHLKPGHREDDMDLHERLFPVFAGVLKAVAEGRWPDAKYDDEIGRKNLAGLTPEQRALWRTESVTAHRAGAPRSGDLAEARSMLRGLDRALRSHPELLKTPGLGRLGFTKGSLARLEAAHAEVLDELRASRRGTPRHRELGARAAELAVPLSMVRFSMAAASAKGDAQSVLLELRPFLPGLESALAARALPNLRAVVKRASFLAGTVTASPKEGTYAADEDNLYALITSTNTGGCVGYDGFRRYANVAFAANAGDKMIRAYDGEKFVGRAVFKLFDAEVEGYDGPVLWLNNVALTNGGDSEHKKLIMRHAILKAQAMGVPVIASGIDFEPVAGELGLEHRRVEVKGKVPDNATGTSFTNYEIVPTSAHDIRTAMAGKPYYENSKTCSVVLPR